MTTATTQHDLEYLLGEQDYGWAAYGDLLNRPDIRFGIGGCLIEQMGRLLDRQRVSPTCLDHRRQRKLNMMAALGFRSPLAMMAWNDEQRDTDAIKRRIKEALNGEYAHVK
jgi:hypothetical protein